MLFGIARRLVEPSRFVFLDESGARTDMTRLHGRSRGRGGKRCVDFASGGRWRTYTMLAAIRATGVVREASLAGPGAMDGEVFLAWVRGRLCPTLSAGDVVVMDNLASHKRPIIAQLIEAAGATVLYLPPYSPGFNPIEPIWSKVKAILRTLAARTIDALHEAFGHALAAVTDTDVAGCFRHCGYATSSGAPL